MQKLSLRCALAAAVILSLTGCVSTSTGGLVVSLKEGGTSAETRVDDMFFRQHIDIVECGAIRTDMGFLKASVLVRNRYGKDFPLQYKFSWFGSDGAEIQAEGRPWEQKVMHGGEDISLQAVAPEKSAVKFAARLRRVK